MRTTFMQPTATDPSAKLHLEPDTERDQATIQKLHDQGRLCGFGRDPVSGEFIHAQVEIASRLDDEEIDFMLEKFDQTDPVLQRRIVTEAFSRLHKAEAALPTLVEAIRPFAHAIYVRDADTMAMASPCPDETVIFTSQGCWTGEAQITIGDLRRLRAAFVEGGFQ